MQRLRYVLVIVALALGVGAVVAGSAAAAKGGNNDTAKQCQKGDWKHLSRNTADTFVNQGDCVNDGAQAHSVFTTAGEAACQQLHDSTFTVGTQHVLWNCQFPNDSQNAGGGDALRQACATDAGPNPLFSLTPLGGDQFFAAECST